MSTDRLKSLCVFCGSNTGSDPAYRQDAALLGKMCAHNSITLIYGGGNSGVMGQLSKAVIANGGKAVGIIPELLNRKSKHDKEVETIVVDNMHGRKALMYQQSDAFVALPGGIGTIEELFEVYTWKQIGYHEKPVALLNSGGYFDHLIDFLDNMVRKKFLNKEHLADLIVADNVDELFARLSAFFV